MEVITYHLATVEDIPILAEYRIKFLLDYWGDQSREAIEDLRRELLNYFSRHIPDGTYVSWYAKVGDEIAGTGGMLIVEKPGGFRVPDGVSGYIMSMYTVPQFRRRGIAREILNRLITYGKTKGINFFELHATKDGVAVYEQAGFLLHNEPTYRKYSAD